MTPVVRAFVEALIDHIHDVRARVGLDPPSGESTPLRSMFGTPRARRRSLSPHGRYTSGPKIGSLAKGNRKRSTPRFTFLRWRDKRSQAAMFQELDHHVCRVDVSRIGRSAVWNVPRHRELMCMNELRDVCSRTLAVTSGWRCGGVTNRRTGLPDDLPETLARNTCRHKYLETSDLQVGPEGIEPPTKGL